VERPRADDAADDRRRRDRVERVLGDPAAQQPHREPHAEENAHRGEDAVPCELDRPEVDVRIERQVQL